LFKNERTDTISSEISPGRESLKAVSQLKSVDSSTLEAAISYLEDS
jgi:hypothetical protein